MFNLGIIVYSKAIKKNKTMHRHNYPCMVLMFLKYYTLLHYPYHLLKVAQGVGA